jgi:RNA polymerase sigma factor (sigma-70 family)
MNSEPLAEVLRHLRVLACTEGGGEQSDPELLRQFVARGDEGAFATLLGRHGPLVLGVCRQVLGDQQDAEDAFQATFLVLARKASSIRRRESLTAWLHRVALNLARTARIGIVRRKTHERQAVLMSGASHVDDAALGDLQLVHEEVDQLPEKYRLPVVICYFDGKTHSEAARALGWPVGTVKGRLARARDLLRTRLARRGLTLSGGALAAALAQSAASGHVPAVLLLHTVKAAGAFAGGGAIPCGVVRVQAVTLAQGALETMTASKLVPILVVILGVVLTVAYGLLAATAPDGQPIHTGANLAEQAAAKPQDADADGDPLPPGAIARLGTLRFRHGDAVLSLAYSPDGKKVASGCGDGTVWVWEAATGKEMLSLKAHHYFISAVAFSPDGKVLISRGREDTPGPYGGAGTIRVWDLATGRELRQFKGLEHGGGVIALSADGKTLAAGSYGTTIFLWDLASGKELRQLKSDRFHAINVALTSDGKVLASGGHCSTVRLWDVGTGTVLREIEHEQPSNDFDLAVAFSPDGKILASGSLESAIRLWDVATGKELAQFKAKQLGFGAVQCYGLRSFTFSPDSRTLAVAGKDGLIRLWDVATGKELQRLEGHHGGVISVTFSADGKTLASGGADASLRLWDVSTGKGIHSFQGHQDRVTSVALSPDGKTLATASADRTLRLWNMPSGKELRCLVGHQGPVASVAWLADAKTLVSADDVATARFWDAATGKEVRQLPLAEEFRPTRHLVTLTPDGKTLAWGWHTIRLVDVATGTELHRVKEGYARAFSPDGKTLAAGVHDDDHPLILWDLQGKELRRFTGEGKWGNHNGVWAVSFSPDGKTVIAGCRDGTVRLWETATGKERAQLCGHQGSVDAIAVSVDGKYLASGGVDRTVRLWHLASGKELAQLQGHRGPITSVALSPDARYVVSGSHDTTILVWDVASKLRK